MTEPTSPRGFSATRRDFLRSSTAATVGLGLLGNAHAAGSDVIKVGLIGCGGRGTGAAENICEAAGTSYNIKLHAMGDVFPDHLKNCRESLRDNKHCKEKFDVADERCFVGFDAYQKVIDCCDLVMLATPPGFRPAAHRGRRQGRQEPLHREAGRRRRPGHPQGPGRRTRRPRRRASASSPAPSAATRPATREHEADPRRRDRRPAHGPRLLEPGGHLGP